MTFYSFSHDAINDTAGVVPQWYRDLIGGMLNRLSITKFSSGTKLYGDVYTLLIQWYDELRSAPRADMVGEDG